MMKNVFLLFCLLVAGSSLQKIPMKISTTREISEWLQNRSSNISLITPDGPSVLLLSGTPPQYTYYSLDTQSGETTVVDVNAQLPHPVHNYLYHPNDSSTSQVSSYPYSSSTVDNAGVTVHLEGVIAEDRFTLEGPEGSFSLKFGLIEAATIDDPKAKYPDDFVTGTIGLGFYAESHLDMFVPKITQNLTSDHKQFSMAYVECMLDPNRSEDTQSFTVGGYDEDFCNSSTVIQIPIAQTGWNFQIQSFSVGNFTENYRQIVSINTKEMMTGVPKSVYNYIVQMTNATEDPRTKMQVVDCSLTYPDLHFNVGLQEFSVSQDLYVFRTFDQLTSALPCHLMVYPLNGGGFLPSWSFGYLWVLRKCIVFDYGRKALQFMDYNTNLCN